MIHQIAEAKDLDKKKILLTFSDAIPAKDSEHNIDWVVKVGKETYFSFIGSRALDAMLQSESQEKESEGDCLNQNYNPFL